MDSYRQIWKNVMSLKLVDAKQTTTKVENGVVWYSNPALTVTVLSDGRVFNNKTNKFLKPTSKGLFSIYFTDYTPYSHPTTYDSLISHVLGLNRGWGEKIKLIDGTKGYVQGNLQLVKEKRAWAPRKSRKSANDKNIRNKKNPIKEVSADIHILETSEVVLYGYKLRVTKAEHTFITEDFKTFDTRKAALEHQLLVDKGKELSSMLINNNVGWSLAREIFHKVVPDNDIKYKHFKDVIENNDGIVEIGTNPTYRFIEQPYLGDYKDLLINREFSKSDANQIASLLAKLNNLSTELLSIIVKD